MKPTLTFVIILSLFVTIFGSSCDHLGILLYEDLGCTPYYENNATCPSKYSCVGLEPWSTECYLKGKSYTKNERTELDDSRPECLTCGCKKYPNKNVMVFDDCMYEDCLGTVPPSGCRPVLPLNGCCPDKICPPFEKCVVNGKEYEEGDTFRPENTCLRCHCRKGFKMEEPFCERTTCVEQILNRDKIQERCAPAYFLRSEKTLCCPDRWLCPDGTERFKKGTGQSGCKFGDNIVALGEQFIKIARSQHFQCKCIIPPLMTCKELQRID